MKSLSAWLLQDGTERAHCGEDRRLRRAVSLPVRGGVVPSDELFCFTLS